MPDDQPLHDHCYSKAERSLTHSEIDAVKHSMFSPAIYYNPMTDHERYLFDLQGFLSVNNVLNLNELDRLNNVMDRRIADECPSEMQTHRFGDLLTWDKAYRQLIDHPKITPYLS